MNEPLLRARGPLGITRHGVILNTARHAECVAFYRDSLGLEILFARDSEDERLTCFDMGGAYLMVESGGVASDRPKTAETCPAKLRFNLTDVAAGAAHLRARGVTVEMRVHDWGTTAEFSDPDGNRCALRSDAGFGG